MIGSERIRVVVYGLGQIGLHAAELLLERRDLELVGIIDNDPKKLQRDIADLSGRKRPSGIRVSDRPEEVLQVTRPDVVIHSTGSRFKSVLPQLKECVKAGCHVVSSCEELLNPHVQYAAQAKELDRMAKGREVVVLGTGVNPGYVMDTMAVAATASCLDVKHIAVTRVVDASSRRENLQKKIGAGLTPSEFRKGVRKKQLGHVGLLESTYLVAEGLGWSLEKVKEKLTPVISKKRVKTDHVTVKAGEVAGIHHVCKGYRNNRECVLLDLQMYVGAKKPTDHIYVKGDPDVELTFTGGVAGDEATVAMLLGMVPAVRRMEHGVRTMVEAPVPRFRAPS